MLSKSILTAYCCFLATFLACSFVHAEAKTQRLAPAGRASPLGGNVLQEHVIGADGTLRKEMSDIESALLEEDIEDAASCANDLQSQQHKEQLEIASTEPYQAFSVSLESVIDFLCLFKDIAWFGVAFVVLCIWHCFVSAQSHLEKLATRGKPVCKETHHVAPAKGTKETTCSAQSSSSNSDVDALLKAMYSENKLDLRKLLDSRSINACDDVSCCTALHVAAHYNNIPAAEALLCRGADTDVRDVWDETPLHFAARAGNVKICSLLLKHSADVNSINADDLTPLLVAAKAEKQDVCELLLDNGGHTGGVSEEEVPAMLNNLLFSRIFKGSSKVSEEH